ncbi:hypothetical protein RAS1_06640 [Phycisphaerae bacterium RAS1]|nr:hypothetical protein RAS1_06640 [Phycisphaerae bacterium RAS1]
MYGTRDQLTPWANPDGAMFIGNHLRAGDFVGITLSWPLATPNNVVHVVTVWGDSGDADPLTNNPEFFIMTDSDREDPDATPDLQTYNYDNFYYPPEPNRGPGWYFDYTYPSAWGHPYIINAVTLSQVADNDPQGNRRVVRATGSYLATNDLTSATGLHYDVGTDTEILYYDTRIMPPVSSPPTIVEIDDPPTWLTVDWTLDFPAPPGYSVFITTDFILPAWNAVWYGNVHFTPDGLMSVQPAFNWQVDTPDLPPPLDAAACGGFVVAAFKVYADQAGTQELCQYRLEHEYAFDQDPESHTFTLTSRESATTLYIGDLHFGHSHGLLDENELWGFENWLTSPQGIVELPPQEQTVTLLDWNTLLPYPPYICVGPGAGSADLNCDGVANILDINPFILALSSPAMYQQQYPLCEITHGDMNGDGEVNILDINGFVQRLTGG